MSRINGQTLLSVFDQEVTRRDAARRQVDSEIAAEERRIAAANARREAAYGELADLYSADGGKLAADFGGITQRLQSIFDEKMRRRQELNAMQDQASALVASHSAKLADALETEHQAEERLAAASRIVDGELQGDAAYQQIKQDAEQAVAHAQQLATAATRIRAEAAVKLAVYAGNRLFGYLLKARYGTPEYRASGVVAAGDRWVAGLAAWNRNYPSYTVLRDLPEFAAKRAEAAARQAELARTKAALYVQEREVAHGVDTARVAVDAAKQARQQLQSQIAELEQKQTKLAAELHDMDAGQDSFQQQAKAEMKAFLAANPVSVLKARAAATAPTRDDDLVAQIEAAESVINNGRSHVKDLVRDRQLAAEQHQRAVRARSRFSADYTGAYDQFSPRLNVGDLLTGYILGSVTEHALWGQVDTHHHDATPTYSYTPSPSIDSGGGSFGGGFSGGGFSTGGGTGGGGFSSGGGF